MEQKRSIIPILIVNYNGIAYLHDCLSSLAACQYDDIEQRLYIVDNDSRDGSSDYIRKNWPQARLIQAERNFGFAGGNNLGWRIIQEELPGCRYLMLLNTDTIVAHNFLEPLVRAMDQQPRVASVQPKILLYPQQHKINSLGNVIHYLGFGYSSYNGVADESMRAVNQSINYASGAAVMLRVAAVREVGLFDDFMFMYLEDLDLGWKFLLRGWENRLVPESIVYHKYEFSRGMRQYYFFERNRLWILLKNYRLLTLLFILPVWLIMEFGMLVRAMVGKTLALKIKSYAYFFLPKHLVALMRDRGRIQSLRVRKDGEIMRMFSGRIDFQPLHDPVLQYVANPLLNLYFKFLKTIIFW